MPDGSSSKLGTIAAVLVAVVGLVSAQIYTMTRLSSLESALATVRGEQKETREAIQRTLDKEIANLRQREEAAAQERQQAFDAMRADVDKARRQAAGAAGRVQQEAQKSVESLAARLDANEQKIQESQTRLTSELTGVRQANNTTQSKIGAVSTDVEAVKTEVASTQSQLDEALAELQRTRGDMGELSGLIATNSDQIQALKTLGDRDYTEFTLFKSKEPVKVGDISVLLKKTDVKKSRYSIEIYVNDLQIEKKDRTINEPLQFFLGTEKQPHELVVNRVTQDQIVGYLASPKTPAAR